MATIEIPLPPKSKAEAIMCLTVLGLSLKETMEAIEANVEAWTPGKRFMIGIAHWLLNEAGYILEGVFGVPDGTFGAGGSNKGGGGGGGG